MYVVLLRFSGARAKALELMEAHKAWIQRGFDDGVFVMTGTLQPNAGGLVVAMSTSRTELEGRVSADPFVVEGVVRAEILDVVPGRVDERLKWLA
ncbi:MAG TPA: YciI family protein [Burkholderiales bacterium]|nr:YciI family protein [Burkholderiales bacterium]